MLNSELKIGIVVSLFNQEVTENLLQSTLTRLLEQGVKKQDIKVIKVPGAVEIPLAAQLLANSKHYHAIICLGAVIRGETSHYDYVCQQVSHGCQQVMLAFNLPVIFGILTTENKTQALARASGVNNKGSAAADSAIHMAKTVSALMDDVPLSTTVSA